MIPFSEPAKSSRTTQTVSWLLGAVSIGEQSNVTKGGSVTRQRRKVGDVVVAKNGYSYTYVEGKDERPERRLTHWVVGEKKYGRPPKDDEMVRFKDGNRRNLEPENIIYISKSNPISALKRRRDTLLDKIREYQEELRDIEKQLAEQGIET